MFYLLCHIVQTCIIPSWHFLPQYPLGSCDLCSLIMYYTWVHETFEICLTYVVYVLFRDKCKAVLIPSCVSFLSYPLIVTLSDSVVSPIKCFVRWRIPYPAHNSLRLTTVLYAGRVGLRIYRCQPPRPGTSPSQAGSTVGRFLLIHR